MPDADALARCQIAVHVRDIYRRTGRGKTWFEMHYTIRRCKRPALDGKDFCAWHAKIIERGRTLTRVANA